MNDVERLIAMPKPIPTFRLAPRKKKRPEYNPNNPNYAEVHKPEQLFALPAIPTTLCVIGPKKAAMEKKIAAARSAGKSNTQIMQP